MRCLKISVSFAFLLVVFLSPGVAFAQLGDCTYTPSPGTSFTNSNVSQANCRSGGGVWTAYPPGGDPPVDPGGGNADGGGPPVGPCTPSTQICNPIRVNNINDFIKTILEGVIKIGIPIIALAIIYSGFLFVTARGSSEQLDKAKAALLYSIIGAVLLLGSWTLAILISETVLQIN